MTRVFLSYVREDRPTVDRLAADLKAYGADVWLDRTAIKPGERWADAIRRGISEGDFFLACFSKAFSARGKTYMNEELTLAIEELRQRSYDQSWFIPVRFDDCEVPARPIGAGETLNSLQRVDLFGDWKEGIRQILSVVRPQEGPLSIHREDLAALTHELLNALLSVRWHLDALRRDGLSAEERGNRVAEALTSTDLASLQVRRLSAIGQAIQEDARVYPTAIDLAKELRAAANLLRPQARSRGLDFRFSGLEALPKRAFLDRTLLQVVLNVVLDNAVKYSFREPKGTAWIDLRATRLSPSAIRLEIASRSLELSADDRDRIFERGYRSREAMMVTPVGSGVGLYVARRLLTAQGGRVGVETRSGGVNAVVIELPVGEP